MQRTWWLSLLPIAAAAALLAAGSALSREQRALARLRDGLRRSGDGEPFDLSMITGLPAPAQRYFGRAIAEGTPLARSVQLDMHGSIRLRPGAEPVPMRARQVLAPPYGFLWKARVGKGLLRINGFDRYAHGAGSMRWRLYGLVPLIHAAGPDVTRSAAGRLGGEAVFVPPTLLPRHGAVWEAVDDATARVTLPVGDERVTFDLAVDAGGRMERVSVRRWTEDTGDGTPGYARFDVDRFADDRTFDGYTIPTTFRAGWRLGDADEYPFFYATIDAAAYR